MGYFVYLSKVFKRAFQPPFGWWTVIQIIISIGLPIAIYLSLLPDYMLRTGETLISMIVLGVIVFFGFVRLFFAPYWLHRDQVKELTPRPKIESVRAKVVQRLWMQSPVFQEKIEGYGVLQAWFLNNPDIPDENSKAESVQARIGFWDGRKLLFTVNGGWLITSAPGHAGFIGRELQVDIKPGFFPVKLALVLKYLDERECYAYSLENLFDDPHGRIEDFMIKEGKYRIKIELLGTRLKQRFWFVLINKGMGEFPELHFSRWLNLFLS